jgi:hypothetical protein
LLVYFRKQASGKRPYPSESFHIFVWFVLFAVKDCSHRGNVVESTWVKYSLITGLIFRFYAKKLKH